MVLNVEAVKTIQIDSLLSLKNKLYYGTDLCEDEIKKAKIASLLLFIYELCPDLKINSQCLYELIK